MVQEVRRMKRLFLTDGDNKLNSLAFFVATLALLLLPTGCAQNTVPLVYTSPAANTIPEAGAPTVCVVAFTDNRPSAAIGKRGDGSEFMPESDVCAWFTTALGTELARKGLIVTQAPDEAGAQASGAAFVVLASVDELWITESNPAEYSVQARATLTVKKGRTSLGSQSFAGGLNRTVVPGAGVPRDLLSETVADLMQPMAQAVYDQVRK
jgi:uncharacterized lipoprotein YajG